MFSGNLMLLRYQHVAFPRSPERQKVLAKRLCPESTTEAKSVEHHSTQKKDLPALPVAVAAHPSCCRHSEPGAQKTAASPAGWAHQPQRTVKQDCR